MNKGMAVVTTQLSRVQRASALGFFFLALFAVDAVSAQAGGDGAGVGDFAGAKSVDVGRAGAALFGRALLR